MPRIWFGAWDNDVWLTYAEGTRPLVLLPKWLSWALVGQPLLTDTLGEEFDFESANVDGVPA